MKTIRVLFLFVITMLFSATLVARSNAYNYRLENELRRFVEEHCQALSEGDFLKVFKQLSVPEENLENTCFQMVYVYTLYEPSYTLVNLRLVNYKVNRDGSIRAEIEATQDTHARKLKRAFTDNRLVARHILEKREGKWYFLSTQVISFVSLEEGNNQLK